tara:strand:- start:411 stop:746 length:336 start_codon:yes stop_codon:yes gene_type:complete
MGWREDNEANGCANYNPVERKKYDKYYEPCRLKMNLSGIKDAIMGGKKVCWKSELYVVEWWSKSEGLFVRCVDNDYCTGLGKDEAADCFIPKCGEGGLRDYANDYEGGIKC